MRRILLPGLSGTQIDITEPITHIESISKVGNYPTPQTDGYIRRQGRRIEVACGDAAPAAVLDCLRGRITPRCHAYLVAAWGLGEAAD